MKLKHHFDTIFGDVSDQARRRAGVHVKDEKETVRMENIGMHQHVD